MSTFVRSPGCGGRRPNPRTAAWTATTAFRSTATRSSQLKWSYAERPSGSSSRRALVHSHRARAPSRRPPHRTRNPRARNRRRRRARSRRAARTRRGRPCNCERRREPRRFALIDEEANAFARDPRVAGMALVEDGQRVEEHRARGVHAIAPCGRERGVAVEPFVVRRAFVGWETSSGTSSAGWTDGSGSAVDSCRACR